MKFFTARLPAKSREPIAENNSHEDRCDAADPGVNEAHGKLPARRLKALKFPGEMVFRWRHLIRKIILAEKPIACRGTNHELAPWPTHDYQNCEISSGRKDSLQPAAAI